LWWRRGKFEFVQRAWDIGCGRRDLATIRAYARILARELDRPLKLKPTKAEGHHFRDTIIVECPRQAARETSCSSS
jgi:hypothetical protein